MWFHIFDEDHKTHKKKLTVEFKTVIQLLILLFAVVTCFCCLKYL